MNNKKLNFWAGVILFLGFFIFIFWVVSNYSNPNSTSNNSPTSSQKKSVYKVDENDLKVVIGKISSTEYGSIDIEILDVRYALQRTTDKYIYDFPFYAMEDPKSDGYIGVILVKNPSETSYLEALFLVPSSALNETSRTKLEKSIKAINGTAKDFISNLQFAGKDYDPVEVLKLIEK